MIKNAAVRAFATLATAAALIGGSAAAAAASAPLPTPEPTVTLRPLPTFPVPFPTLRPVRTPVLYDVDYDRRARCEVVTFHFRNDAPEDVDARWVRQLRESPSRRLVRLPGRAQLLVQFDEARSVLYRGTQYPGLREVRALRQLGDFRGTVSVGLGVRQRDPFWVRTVGDDVVLTVCPNWRGPDWGPFPRPLNNDTEDNVTNDVR